jgi:hypothetical protein
MRGSGRSAARGRRGIRLGFLGVVVGFVGVGVRGGFGKRVSAGVGVVGNRRTNRKWVELESVVAVGGAGGGGGGKALVRHTGPGDDTAPVGNDVGPQLD